MRRTSRRGYTLMEMIVILALLIILGVAILPTLGGFYGNTRQRSAADAVRGRLADARARAMEEGIPYRVSVNQDKTRIRLAPDSDDYVGLPADDPPAFNSKVIEDKLDPATAEIDNPDGTIDTTPDAAGWVTIAVFKPTGDLKGDRDVTVIVKEADFKPILIQVRGVTGSASVTPAPKGGL